MSVCFYIIAVCAVIACVITACYRYMSYYILVADQILGFCAPVAVFALIIESFLWLDYSNIETKNESRLPVRVEMTQKRFMRKPKTVTTFILPGRSKKFESVKDVKTVQVECDLSDIEAP